MFSKTRKPRKASPPLEVAAVTQPALQLAQILGPPALLIGEDRAGYEALVAQITHAMKPRDVIEHLFVIDVVEEAWHLQRLRRVRAGLMHNHLRAELTRKGEEWRGKDRDGGERPDRTDADLRIEAGLLALCYLEGDTECRVEVAAYLAEEGLTIDAIYGLVLERNAKTFEHLDRNIAAAMAGWQRVLREAGRHRDRLAPLLTPGPEEDERLRGRPD